MNILLDYAFPVTAVSPISAASTGFLKKVCVVVKPKSMVTTGTIAACTTNAAIAALTDNIEAQQLLSAGMASVFILPMDDLNLADALEGHESEFYTVLISSDFDDENEDNEASGTVTITSYANLVDGTDDDITINGVSFVAQEGAATLGQATFQAATSNNDTATSLAAQINAHADLDEVVAVANGAVVTITAVDPGAAGNAITIDYDDNGTSTIGATVSGATLTGGTAILNLGEFSGVTGLYADTAEAAAAYAAVEKRAGFFANSTNKAKNMMYAFGKLLSNALSWRNQQYITMPLNDGVDTLGEAEALFDDKVSFVISDSEFGIKLGLFACGGKAIVAPYIQKNMEIDIQSAALTWISGNQPSYSLTSATLLENHLKKVVQGYIDRGLITDGTISILLEQSNFVASGYINIAEPKALWRVFAEMSQTL
jgi:hypothetical protein